MNLRELTQKSKILTKKFPQKFQWGKKERYLDLLILADCYKIDLEKEYLMMLKRLEKRIKKGEFQK